jgi:hypothetical protein
MSVKRTLLAATTTLALLGGAAAAGPAETAAGATLPCGPRCIDFFSRQAGSYRHPGAVFDVLGGRARAGQPVIGFRASRRDPGEDFTISFQAQVPDLLSAGLVTAWLAKRYPNDFGFEIQYAPLGVDSGFCVGTAATAVNGTPVSLQPCGASARTVWIVDLADSVGPPHPYAALINGSETRFVRPYLLTYPRNPRRAGPAGRQLVTRTLQRPARHGPAGKAQLWGADRGVLP